MTDEYPVVGLTKREYFAALLMAGLFEFGKSEVKALCVGKKPNHTLAARTAVEAADALIDALALDSEGGE